MDTKDDAKKQKLAERGAKRFREGRRIVSIPPEELDAMWELGFIKAVSDDDAAALASQDEPQLPGEPNGGRATELRALANSKRILGDACSTCQELSRYIWNWMDRQSAVGEESVTDWYLFELSERLPWVKYVKFNRFEESRSTGADWEWWFVSQSTSLALRVQAKRLLRGKDHYPGLAHANPAGLQIELLMQAALRENKLPFYVLYHRASPSTDVLCRGGLRTNCHEGVFLADAPSIYDRFIKPGRAKVEASSVVAQSNPLSCLFCCPLTSDQHPDPVRGIYDQLLEYFGDGIRAPGNANMREPGLHSEPPEFLRSLLELNEPAVPEWWESEFRRQLPDTRAILIFDLRETRE